jgi:alpha-1,2-mannosyltransferase
VTKVLTTTRRRLAGSLDGSEPVGQPEKDRTDRPGRNGLALLAGIAAALVAATAWLVYFAGHRQILAIPLDLRIYRDGGLIASQVRPWYNGGLASPLYDWPGYHGLKFTYSPFAAMVFIVLTGLTATELLLGSMAVSLVALAVAIWCTLGAFGVSSRAARAGWTLLGTAGGVLLEPVPRTLSLGQIELVLLALVVWDMCQPDRRRWKGMGVGVAAGIKLVSLIFIPYLLLTRRYRQAAVAAGTFAATVLIGFLVMPADSRAFWFGGVFGDGSRIGFVGFGGNQSLRGLITRLAGSVAGAEPVWLAVAAVTLVAGLVAAASIDRAGNPLLGVLGCALTGLLVSPISWDHHWVWAVPAVVALAGYGARARGIARWGWFGAVVAVLVVFAAWPLTFWGSPPGMPSYRFGLIWIPPDPVSGTSAGQSWHPAYHWHGLDLLAGNSYVLSGLLLLVLLTALAARPPRSALPPAWSSRSARAGRHS